MKVEEKFSELESVCGSMEGTPGKESEKEQPRKSEANQTS